MLRGIQLEYAYLLEDLVNSGRYDTTEDFTVVLQPHMRDIELPRDVRKTLYSHYYCSVLILGVKSKSTQMNHSI